MHSQAAAQERVLSAHAEVLLPGDSSGQDCPHYSRFQNGRGLVCFFMPSYLHRLRLPSTYCLLPIPYCLFPIPSDNYSRLVT